MPRSWAYLLGSLIEWECVMWIVLFVATVAMLSLAFVPALNGED
jgi:hypothetical protein